MRMGSIKERERCRGGAGGKEGWRWGGCMFMGNM